MAFEDLVNKVDNAVDARLRATGEQVILMLAGQAEVTVNAVVFEESSSDQSGEIAEDRDRERQISVRNALLPRKVVPRKDRFSVDGVIYRVELADRDLGRTTITGRILSASTVRSDGNDLVQ